MSLTSLIVQREIASIREVEEALARQVLYGGDLVTNLVEVSRVDEAALVPVVAESFGLPSPPPRPPSLAPEPMRSPSEPPRTPGMPDSLVRKTEVPPPRQMKRRRGPLTAEVARTELEDVDQRDTIFDVVFEFARQYFDYTAL